MTRKKVELAYITNNSVRKATFKKRKKGLLKKVSELSILCGVEACAIIYGQFDLEPEVWPSPSGVNRVLSRFQKMPEIEQGKKMMDQETFLGQRIAKANEQLKKQQKDNREKELTQMMFQTMTANSFHYLNMLDLNDLELLIDRNLEEINKRIETLQNTSHPQAATSFVAGPGTEEYTLQQAEKATFEGNIDTMKTLQWFMPDLVSPQEPMGFGGQDEMILPFGDSNYKSIWSNAFIP